MASSNNRYVDSESFVTVRISGPETDSAPDLQCRIREMNDPRLMSRRPAIGNSGRDQRRVGAAFASLGESSAPEPSTRLIVRLLSLRQATVSSTPGLSGTVASPLS